MQEVDRERFGEYLLGELRWEVANCVNVPPELHEIELDRAEVISFSGYESLILMTLSGEFEVGLCWRPDRSPTIRKCERRDESA